MSRSRMCVLVMLLVLLILLPPRAWASGFNSGVPATGAGSGNVSNSGTPTNGQLALWTNATTLQGVTPLPCANTPAFTGDVTSSAGSCALTLAHIPAVSGANLTNLPAAQLSGTITPATQDLITSTGTLVSGATGAGFTLNLAASTVSGPLPCANEPALTGDVSTSLCAATIANSAVSYAKLQNVSATSRLLGRITAGAGVVEELTAANVKTILALAASDLSNGTTGSGGGIVLATAPTMAGGVHTGLTSFGLRDTSAAFDVTLAAVSSTTLTAGRIVTLDTGNVAHTLALGTAANTITFPSLASYTVAQISAAQSFTGLQTFNTGASILTALYMNASVPIRPISGGNSLIIAPNMGATASYGINFSATTSYTAASGNAYNGYSGSTFAPTTGTGQYAEAVLTPTINQTGGANGITRGLWITPTLTAAADFRALEVTLGKVVITPLASSSGVRFACFDSVGQLVSQTAACVGT